MQLHYRDSHLLLMSWLLCHPLWLVLCCVVAVFETDKDSKLNCNASYHVLLFFATLLHLLLQKAGYIPSVAQRQKERDFYKLWKLLGALKEEEQRVKSFLVLTEAKGQPQLTAIQVVLEKLVITACELVRINTIILLHLSKSFKKD